MKSVLADQYPTRTATPESAFERSDPTVWDEQPGPLSTASIEEYDEHGFLVERDLFSLAAVRVFSDAASVLRRRADLAEDPRVIREKSDQHVRSIFEAQVLERTFGELARDARLVDRARQILGSDVYVHQCRINYMPGFTGKGFYWHSDFETWHAEDGMPSPRAVSVSLALTTNYAYNGSLMVMPGSHRRFVPCVGATPEEHFRQSLQEQEVGTPSQADLTSLAEEFGIDQFTGPMGSVLFFDSNLMHGSGSNITPFARSNIFIVFNSVENTLVAPFSSSAPRPGFVANRDFLPVGQ